jgi:copper homeostasis protein (lipoprotein)
MKILSILSVLLFILVFYSCDSPSNETDNYDNLEAAEIVLEGDASIWIAYKGIIPCADCEGIEMELQLENKSEKNEKEFELTETYLGTPDGNRTFTSRGTYEITYGLGDNPTAIVISLVDENKQAIKTFIQEDDQSLMLLGVDGKMMDSQFNYRLIKK